MSIFYIDPVNGNDANNGSTWALAWKTITTGATAVRIAPGDVIRIAKSPAPVSLGTTGAWTNLSKTVTLGVAQTLNIDLVEANWTAIAGGDATPTLVAVATDGKQGSNCVRITLDVAVQASKGQAYKATGILDLSAYQKISFWIKNSSAILATHYTVRLCSDVAGATTVDTFIIPAIPSVGRWVPLTIARNGGGNLGASIQSIAIYTDTVAPTNSSNILIDNFIACTTDGLNLQSLISKNSVEQGGNEPWLAIQSINDTTVMLDNETNTKANAGRGYSGTTETVATYKRETIKTTLVATSTTVSQQVMDSGTVISGIQFQGGYDTSTNNQTGETFFDGLNGNGYGIYLSNKNYITLNYLNVCRYNKGWYFLGGTFLTITNLDNANNNITGIEDVSSNITIVSLLNANNNGLYGYTCSGNNGTITTISNINNNLTYGFVIGGMNLKIGTFSNANNNEVSGITFTAGHKNIIDTVSNAKNNGSNGIYFNGAYLNLIKSISTSGNASAGIASNTGVNYIQNALIGEITEFNSATPFANSRLFSNNHDQTAGNHWIYTDGGTINSLATDRVGGTGIMWKLAISSSNRASYYPLNLSIAKIAVSANNLVTVKAYMKKDHATNVVGKLVCRGGQIAGVSNDVTATKASDTNWEELTITFTPTEAGVVEIDAWAYYSAGNSNVYVEDMTITQA